MEHVADVAPMVQILDAPVPLMVDQLVDVTKHIDISVPEQVIEVPKISCPSSSRGSRRHADGGAVGGSARAGVGHPGTRHQRTWWYCTVPGCGAEGVCWWMVRTNHTQWTPLREAPPAQGDFQGLPPKWCPLGGPADQKNSFIRTLYILRSTFSWEKRNCPI